jgi:ATP-dependent RNA helicase DeaD
MLAAIEKATRQTIERMHVPSNEEVADRRVMAFKQTLTETIESQDLAFFENLINQYQEEHNSDPVEIAAALAFLVQKSRPLVPVKHSSEKRERPAEKSKEGHQQHRREKRKQDPSPRHQTEEGMVTYRVEVGSTHDVFPKHLVGAIANEAGLDSEHIGRISIMEDHSFVDLPDGMPKDIFQHLRKVWVNQHQLNISLADSEESANQTEERKPRRSAKPANHHRGKPSSNERRRKPRK